MQGTVRRPQKAELQGWQLSRPASLNPPPGPGIPALSLSKASPQVPPTAMLPAVEAQLSQLRLQITAASSQL